MENQILLKRKYPDKFEVYLISDLNDKPLYAGQGQCGRRAYSHLQPKKANKLCHKPNELKILFQVIVENKQEAIELEEKFINQFKPLFNVCKRNTGISKGHQMSEETRRKMSESKLGKKFSDEHKKNLSLSHNGHKVSDETKQKLREKSLNYHKEKK